MFQKLKYAITVCAKKKKEKLSFLGCIMSFLGNDFISKHKTGPTEKGLIQCFTLRVMKNNN